jgi:hypothetical protein
MCYRLIQKSNIKIHILNQKHIIYLATTNIQKFLIYVCNEELQVTKQIEVSFAMSLVSVMGAGGGEQQNLDLKLTFTIFRQICEFH